MNAERVVAKALAMGVRLTLNGNVVKLRGPSDSIAAIKPELAAHKPEIVDYLRRAANNSADLSRYPVADGPFMPYMAPLSPERVAGLLADLRETISKVADIEGWPDDCLAYLLGLVARQPVSTLADDLAYFRERLNTVESLAGHQNVSSEHIVKGTRKGGDVYAGRQIAQIDNERRRAP
ncbi:hypothetical protein ACI2UC_20325 [Ralstonia nicotianae]